MSLKTRSRKRVLFLVAALALAIATAGSFYGYRKLQIRRQYARMLADGLAAAEAGNNQQALDLLGTYLQRYPDRIEALAQYGRIRPLIPLPKGEHIRDSIYVLRHLLKLDSARPDAQKELLHLYVQTHYWSEALALADAVIPPGKKITPADVEPLEDQTRALIGTRNYADAFVRAREWNRVAPANLDAQLLVLDLAHQTLNFKVFSFVAQNDTHPELKLAEELVQRGHAVSGPATQPATQDPGAEIVRGHAALLARDVIAAATHLKAAAALPTPDRHASSILIGELDRLGLLDDSKEVLKRLYKTTSDPEVRDILAMRLWESGDSQGVADLLSPLTETDPHASSEMLALRAASLLRLKREPEANRIREALARRTDDATALAWAAILDSNDGHPVDLQRVSVLCQQALQADHSAYLGYFLGDAYARQGEIDLAVAAWKGCIDRNNTWAAPLMRMAQVFTDAGRYEQALRWANEAAFRDVHSVMAQMILVRAWDLAIQAHVSGQSDALLAKIASIDSKIRDDGQLACVRVDVLGAAGQTGEAEATIQRVLAVKENRLNPASLLQMAALSRKYKLGLEEQCLSRYRADQGVTPELAWSGATGLFLAGRPAEGATFFDAERAKSATPQSLDWRLAKVRYLDLIQDARAHQEVVSLADDYPSDSRVQLESLEFRSTREDQAFLQRTIERVHTLTGEQGVAWRLARARFLLAFTTGESENAQATKLLSDVLQVSPQSVQAHVLLAQALQRAHQVNDAVEQLKIATGLSPSSVPLGLSLIQMLASAGEFDAAREELARVRSVPWSDPDQRRKAAVLAAQVGDPRLALSLVQEAAAQSTEANGQDLLLAQMHWLSGNAAEAKLLCDKLLAHPDLSVIQFAADLYASTGNVDRATQILTGLDSLKLEPGLKELVLADFAGRHEGSEIALRHIENATRLNLKSSAAWRALVAFQFGAGHPADAIDAIRRGARQMPNDPAMKALQAQINLLSAVSARAELRPFAIAFARNPQDPAAADVLNTLSGQLSAPPSRDGLCDTVKSLAQRYPQFLPLQTYLTQTYINAGRREDALNAAAAAARQFPGVAEPQALYVSLLRAQERWSEVLGEAQRWRDRTLARPLAADLQIAEAYLKLRRPSDAMKQLEGYVSHQKEAPDAYAAVLPMYAAARQAVGQTGTAELMEPLLQQGARGRAAWMTFAVENLDPGEAAGWLDRVEPVIPADAIGERVLLSRMWGTLADRRHDPADAAKARSIIAPLASNPNADAQTIMTMGLRDEQDGDSEAAATEYRRVLKLAPGDIIARNNLAMILARSGSNLDEAAGLVQNAIQSRSDVPALYDTLAYIEGREGHYDQAVEHAKTAVHMQPQHAQFHVTLAQLLLDSGKRADAALAIRELDNATPSEQASQSIATQKQIKAIREAVKRGADQVSAR